MKPGEVASLLGVAGATIRSWSNEFGMFMSPTGTGGGGRHRDFTEADIRMLQFIRDQRAQGGSREVIASALREMVQAGTVDDLPMSEPHVSAQVPVVPSALIDETRRSMLRENANLQERIVKLEMQLDQERGSRETLLRELSELNGELQRALLIAELYESGRLEPNS